MYRIIPVVEPSSLLAVAKVYGLDKTWSSQAFVSIGKSHLKQHEMVFGTAALEKCLAECQTVEKACDSWKSVESVCEYALVLSEYLENTRTLI